MPEKNKKLEDLIQKILARASQPEAGRRALAMLFPKAERYLATYVISGDREAAQRIEKHRISVAEFAPTYFRLDAQRATWGRSEIGEILDAPDPLNSARQIEAKLDAASEGDRPRLRRLILEQLEGAFGERTPFSLPWLKALIDMSRMFILAADESTTYMFSENNEDRLRRVIIRALETVSTEERLSLLSAAISDAPDLTILCDVLRGLGGDRDPRGAKRAESSWTADEGFDRLRDLLLGRIREVVTKEEFWMQAEPRTVLWFWWGCNGEHEVQAFTRHEMEISRGLRNLLQLAITRVRSSAGDYEKVDRRSCSLLVDVGQLELRARAWISETEDENDQKIIARFLTALARGDRE